MYVIFIYN